MSLSAKLTAALAMLATIAGYARSEYGAPAAAAIPGDGGRLQRAAQTGTIISVVVIATVGLVGVLILSRVNGALPKDALYDGAETEENLTQLGDSSTAIIDGFSGAMELVPVVLLVLVAALVIGVVQRMRMQG